MIQDLIQQTARKVRVAASFLPLEGPLPPGQGYVPASELELQPIGLQQNIGAIGDQNTRDALRSVLGVVRTLGYPTARSNINEHRTLPLIEISSPVFLKSGEAHDPELKAARQLFTRAASVLARLEDAIVFNGLSAEDANGSRRDRLYRELAVRPSIYVIRGAEGEQLDGLIEAPGRVVQNIGGNNPQALIEAVAAAVLNLEGRGYYGPFACVLSHALYRLLQARQLDEAQPSERIEAFLGGGPLLRSSTINGNQGAVICLGGSPVDLVVGSDLAANFIQLTSEPRYLVAVSEKLRLRVRERLGGPPWRVLQL
jgi:uncharacterized linocin/CFP29 family protein